MEEKEVILTQEGHDNLEKELNYLKTEKRAEIAERIKVALGFGDLSENSEYDEAKNAQAENEVKIVELENKLRHAKIIDEKEIDTETVQIGNVVKVHDLEFDEKIEYTIVGSTEVDLAENKISNESPLGEALLGAKKGQTVEVNAPAGIMKYKILSIKYLDPDIKDKSKITYKYTCYAKDGTEFSEIGEERDNIKNIVKKYGVENVKPLALDYIDKLCKTFTSIELKEKFNQLIIDVFETDKDEILLEMDNDYTDI